jgi:protein phosphatase
MAESELHLRSTALSDVGYVRANNQDSAFAGSRLIAIADGMGGHAGGDTASTIAIRTLAHLERAEHRQNIAGTTAALEKSILAAHDAIVGKAKKEQELAGMGTTVDAVALVRGYWILAHIGDSRAYLLRGGRLIRVSKDHSYVQHLIDTKRITPAEAKNHPQRNVVMRVLGDFDIDPHPDISVRAAQAGDRWLLCSDGLCGPLEDETIAEVLSSTIEREECAQQLVNMALKAGSTDNVSAVIGDAVASEREILRLGPAQALQVPLVAGAAAASLPSIADVVRRPVASAPKLRGEKTPAQKAAELADHADATSATASKIEDPEALGIDHLSADQRIATPSTDQEEDSPLPDTGEIPVVAKSDGSVSTDPSDPEVAEAVKDHAEEEERRTKKHRIRKRIAKTVITVIVLAGLAVGAYAGWGWSQSQYYLGSSDGVVAIYQGVPTNIFGFQLSHKIKDTTTKVSALPKSWRDQLAAGITAESYQEAIDHAAVIDKQAKAFDASKDKDASADSTDSSDSKNDSKSDADSKDSASGTTANLTTLSEVSGQ